MPAHERRIDRARRLAQRSLVAIGQELREARLTAGMTLREVSAIVDVSIAELSRIERGQSPHVAYETVAVVASALGRDVPLRAYPNGDIVRDAAQLALAQRFRGALAAGVRMRRETTLGIPGDLRAWDAVVDGAGWSTPVEFETRIRDVQALQRRLALKARDAGVTVVLLVVANTRHNRLVVRQHADDLAVMFPIPGRAAALALSRGDPPSGSSIILI